MAAHDQASSRYRPGGHGRDRFDKTNRVYGLRSHEDECETCSAEIDPHDYRHPGCCSDCYHEERERG